MASVEWFLLLAWAAYAQAPAAPIAPAARGRSSAPSAVDAEERAELRRELERHAEVLEAQSAVLKIVAKLVGPAVVHIEADLPPEANGHRRRNPASWKNPARA